MLICVPLIEEVLSFKYTKLSGYFYQVENVTSYVHTDIKAALLTCMHGYSSGVSRVNSSSLVSVLTATAAAANNYQCNDNNQSEKPSDYTTNSEKIN